MPVRVVNLIPVALSGETQRDSEPNIAVNPANPRQIAASAFTPDPANSGNGPIFVSTDGGNTWVLNVVLPGGNRTGDISLRFAQNSGVLYSGILRSDAGLALRMNILRAANFTAAGVLPILVTRDNIDQPWVEAATPLGGAGTGADHVYVSNNDLGSAGGRTANVDQSLNAATAPAPAGFGTAALETRATSGQDGPAVRTAWHHDGTVYAVFLGWRGSGAGGTITSDVVVVRDDDWGAGATPYRDLVDTDTFAGVRVASGVTLPPFASQLGTQRTGASVAIAVDPRDSRTVYVAWIDGATGAAATIRVRRSTNGGQTWSGDLRTIATATNPCLAITIRGRVGFMYQQLGNPGTGNRWRTHLEVSADGFATAPTDFVLADVPDASGTYVGANPIGDYANLIAVGKNCYGAFSANNTPTNANFPNGVTYQRNANFATSTLLAVDNVTPVAVSIDPFMVEYTDVAPADDFYVRDWTDSPTSGDTGLEPSTHPVFYATSDVWNRRGTLPGTFPNDQPENEDAGNGTGTTGDNWAFARIRRNAAGTGSTTATAHFLVSKLGTGSNYVDDSIAGSGVTFGGPDPTLTFAAADLGPTTTAALPWHLDAVSSTHLCLAVEISSPADPFVAPSLLGRAPGWPATDLSVLNDNNKAQRNMGLSTTPARGAGMSDAFYAIVHNAATYRRDMTIGIEASETAVRRLKGARIHPIGGRQVQLEPGATLVLRDMEPGENRWIGLSYVPPRGKPGEVIAVHFKETVDGRAINGFGLGARIGTDAQVVRAAVERHRSVLARLAGGFDFPDATEGAERAAALAAKRRLGPSEYHLWLRGELRSLEQRVRTFLKRHRGRDEFDIATALDALAGAVRRRSWSDAAAAHDGLLNRLDAFLTFVQLERGDPADVVQNVRWQGELYARRPALRRLECAARVSQRSRDFVNAAGARRLRQDDYVGLIRELLPAFTETEEAVGGRGLGDAIIAMTEERDPAMLQKVHREFLLGLERYARGRGRGRTRAH
jgi:hypothetical protein